MLLPLFQVQTADPSKGRRMPDNGKWVDRIWRRKWRARSCGAFNLKSQRAPSSGRILPKQEAQTARLLALWPSHLSHRSIAVATFGARLLVLHSPLHLLQVRAPPEAAGGALQRILPVSYEGPAHRHRATSPWWQKCPANYLCHTIIVQETNAHQLPVWAMEPGRCWWRGHWGGAAEGHGE